MKIDSQYAEKFESRHIGPDAHQVEEMLKVIKAASLDELIDQTIPASIRLKNELSLPAAKSEYQFLQDFKKIASQKQGLSNHLLEWDITIPLHPE